MWCYSALGARKTCLILLEVIDDGNRLQNESEIVSDSFLFAKMVAAAPDAIYGLGSKVRTYSCRIISKQGDSSKMVEIYIR